MIALGQGGQALDMDAEESAEGIGLGLAQLRELRGDVLDGAVPLAQLDTDAAVVADRADAGSVALDPQGLDEGPCALPGISTRGGDTVPDTLLELADALVGEGAHGVGAGVVAQEPHGIGREAVVVGPEAVVPGVADDPFAGRTTAPALAVLRGPAVHGALLGELVEVAAHARGGQPEPAGDAGGGDGAELTDDREDAVTGARITGRDVDLRRRRVPCWRINHTSMLRNCPADTTEAPLTHPRDLPCLDSAPVTRAVVVEDLRRVFGDVVAVDGASWAAAAGEITCVLGPNGAGKTTTIECLEGLQRPDSGACRVLGADPWRADAAHRARVGVMLQDGGLPQSVSAHRLLTHLGRLYTAHRRAELVDRLGIAPFARTPVRRLSGGQRQRLGLAAALVGDPDVAFLDEPTAGLDPHARLEVWDLLRERVHAGTALVVTTHGFEEAERLADRIVILDRGRVVADGAPEEIARGSRLEDAYFALTGGPGGR